MVKLFQSEDTLKKRVFQQFHNSREHVAVKLPRVLLRCLEKPHCRYVWLKYTLLAEKGATLTSFLSLALTERTQPFGERVSSLNFMKKASSMGFMLNNLLKVSLSLLLSQISGNRSGKHELVGERLADSTMNASHLSEPNILLLAMVAFQRNPMGLR